MAATSRGIDVSEFQGQQDWAALVRGGLTFAMAKATEGRHTTDDHYAMHMRGMRAAGVLPGAYHFAWPNQAAAEEADHYISVVRADAEAVPGFHHWLDLERNEGGTNYAGCTAAGVRAYAEAWVARVKAAFPRQRVGCYTSAGDIADGHYPRNSDGLWYPAYPRPAINYTQAGERSRPTPGGIPAWGWQFADAPTDQTIAYMTPTALHAWAGHEEDDMPTPQDYARAVVAELMAHTADDGTKSGTQMTTFGDAFWWLTANAAQGNAAAQRALAEVGALRATVAALSARSDLTAEQITEAAKAGGLAALAEGVVHVEVTGVPPQPTTAPTNG